MEQGTSGHPVVRPHCGGTFDGGRERCGLWVWCRFPPGCSVAPERSLVRCGTVSGVVARVVSADLRVDTVLASVLVVFLKASIASPISGISERRPFQTQYTRLDTTQSDIKHAGCKRDYLQNTSSNGVKQPSQQAGCPLHSQVPAEPAHSRDSRGVRAVELHRPKRCEAARDMQ